MLAFGHAPQPSDLAFAVLLLSLVRALRDRADGRGPPGSAQVSGLWCGEGLLREASLQLAQHQQEFDGTLMHRQRSRHVEGSIEGNTLRTMAGKAGELVLQLQGGRLRIVTAAEVRWRWRRAWASAGRPASAAADAHGPQGLPAERELA